MASDGIIQGYSKRSKHLQQFNLKNLLMLSPCPVYGWKVSHSKFWYRWSEAAHHWGCGYCYMWHATTSVRRAGLSIWHLPRHPWGSHRVLVRCESNFANSPFSLYIARRHMFNSACKISFWKCIILFEYPCIQISWKSAKWFKRLFRHAREHSDLTSLLHFLKKGNKAG
jgi:hypothetical protein